jgi:hypothetical protein
MKNFYEQILSNFSMSKKNKEMRCYKKASQHRVHSLRQVRAFAHTFKEAVPRGGFGVW